MKDTLPHYRTLTSAKEKKKNSEQMNVSLSHIPLPMPSLVFIHRIFINCDIGQVLGEDMKSKALEELS